MSDIETVNVDGIPEDGFVLDVREDYEFEAGHVPGATHIPMAELPERFEELDPDEDVYVICRTGGRSAQASLWLTAQGYTAINVAGGSGAWIDAGKEIVSENGETPVIK
ncbi:MAG: rhodanese-like domain-containing protein [Galactobacter sp.]|uniref:rhodanese-like domain-containing protein n=1 Tax=Galactobacter sp. TaxID=2676125 RepID=UPI0025B8F587|nr:rhodanese-like domain-containing protein [Galactobacter sp.]